MTTRRLAAIMFTDIAGYTAMMQADEQLARVSRDRHRSVLESFHKEFGGEIIQYYGDGSLSIFSSGIEAVRCAIEIQLALRQNPEVPVRIGLHTGDIVREEAGIYGDSVNVASRLESLSVPGAILISGKLAGEVKNQTDIQLKSRGSFAFKNVEKEIEVFAVANSGILVPEARDLEGKLSAKHKSIAVLPFVNMSADPENEYFSQGISEEILNTLARMENLQVTARTSSFAFKDKQVDIREIGKQLNVKTILEGSVRKFGNRVRITAQLVNTADGYHIWSDTYDRDLGDIFALQDEVTHKIIEKLKANFSEEIIQSKVLAPPTKNLKAYELFLKANFHLNLLTPASITQSIVFAEEALEEDPDYIDPYILLGYAYSLLGESELIPVEELNEKMDEVIGKAISLGSNHSFIHTAGAARSMIIENRLEPAKGHILEALKLNPNDIMANVLMGFYQMVMEDFDLMQHYFQTVKEIDPMNPWSIELVSWGHFHREEYELAIQSCFDVLKLVPNYRPTLETLGWIYCIRGEYEEALRYLEKISSEMGLRLMKSASLGYTYGLMGQEEKAMDCIKSIFEMKEKQGGERYNLNLAIVYLGMKDYDNFFKHWGIGLEKSAPSAILFFPFPLIKLLHDDPRYIALKKQYLPQVAG